MATDDIELERQMVEENSPAHYPTSDDGGHGEETLRDVELAHEAAQETGEVFEGGYSGDGL